MNMFEFLMKNKAPEPFVERNFECKRGDLTIRGTEYRPEGENLPIAIISHGFMAWQDTVRHYAKELARMGYCAYCFDFCGGSVMKKGKSDGKTTEMSVLTEVQDLEAVIGYVQSLPYIGSELLLMGCSQGGFVSALVATKHPSLVDKLALFYPALCIPDDARAGKMMFAKFDPKNPPEIINCGPMKLGKCYPADVLNMDPYEKIQGVTCPVLIVHGTADKIVHPDYARRAEATYKATTAVQLHIIEGGSHSFSKKHDAIAMGYLRDFAKR